LYKDSAEVPRTHETGLIKLFYYAYLMTKKKPLVVAVSGGFDPIHIGHIEMLERAKKLGDELVVILNNDNWLNKKKGYVFMLQKDRKNILEAVRFVDRVIISSHPKNPKDMSVCADLDKLRPDIFANGGDRDKKDSKRKESSLNPEQVLCTKLGIRTVYGLGKKIRSSSELVKATRDRAK
jgi:D-beta-D-heptose 7-phosphate kinase/D-beta-D-heptose 1-phosphate adenosyltransferase